MPSSVMSSSLPASSLPPTAPRPRPITLPAGCQNKPNVNAVACEPVRPVYSGTYIALQHDHCDPGLQSQAEDRLQACLDGS